MELLYCYMVISGIRRPYFLFRLRYIMLAVKTECHSIVGNYIHFIHTFILEYWDCHSFLWLGTIYRVIFVRCHLS